jgi:hypothetical protein
VCELFLWWSGILPGLKGVMQHWMVRAWLVYVVVMASLGTKLRLAHNMIIINAIGLHASGVCAA